MTSAGVANSSNLTPAVRKALSRTSNRRRRSHRCLQRAEEGRPPPIAEHSVAFPACLGALLVPAFPAPIGDSARLAAITVEEMISARFIPASYSNPQVRSHAAFNMVSLGRVELKRFLGEMNS